MELWAMIARAFPFDMPPETAQGWIEDPEALKRAIRAALMPPERKSEFLRLISSGERIILDVLDGSRTIANADGVFTFIDPYFENLEIDECELATEAMAVEVYEIVKGPTFGQFINSMGKLSDLCLTQAQIIDFVMKHRGWLLESRVTFFFFQSHGKFFAANVSFNKDGSLNVFVFRFESGAIWFADCCRRVVLPILT